MVSFEEEAPEYNETIENGLPRWLSDKESDAGLVPGSRRFPGGGNGSPLQCSLLENPMDRGAWWATVRSVTKSQTQHSTAVSKSFIVLVTVKLRSLGASGNPAVTNPISGSFLALLCPC